MYFLSRKKLLKILFSKPSSRYPLFFERILKLCAFILNMDRDELVLKRRSASFFTDFVFRRPVNDTKKKSSWAKKVYVMRLRVKGRFPVK